MAGSIPVSSTNFFSPNNSVDPISSTGTNAKAAVDLRMVDAAGSIPAVSTKGT